MTRALLIACVLASTGAAQVKKESSQVLVLQLRFTKAEAIAKLLKELHAKGQESKALVIPEPTTNRLLLRGSMKELQEIVKLVSELDAEDQDANQLGVRVYPLKHLKLSDELEKMLKLLVPEKTGSFAFDPRTNSIVLRGTRSVHEAVSELIRSLDVAKGQARERSMTIQLRVVWLKEGKPNANQRAIPKDLESVETALKKMGIGNLHLVGQMLVSAQTGREVRAQGQVAKDAKWSISGLTDLVEEKIELQIEIVAGAANEEINLSTQLTTPLEHVVVLGAAPSQGSTSVFAIQIVSTTGRK